MKSVPVRAQGTTLRYAREPASLARRRRRAALLAFVGLLFVAWASIVAARVSEPFARLFDGDAPLRALSARTTALERRTEVLQQTVDALRAPIDVPADAAFTTL
jgi:hypothetical protein